MADSTLTAQVKRKLNITWSDEATDARLNDIIEAAIPTMIHKLGISDAAFDFSVAGAENTLFLSYCLYEWENVAETFDVNYANSIAQVQNVHAVADMEAAENAEI